MCRVLKSGWSSSFHLAIAWNVFCVRVSVSVYVCVCTYLLHLFFRIIMYVRRDKRTIKTISQITVIGVNLMQGEHTKHWTVKLDVENGNRGTEQNVIWNAEAVNNNKRMEEEEEEAETENWIQSYTIRLCFGLPFSLFLCYTHFNRNCSGWKI